ncbi:Dual specificity protein phosphatase cdc14a [Allomyces arbusculus]|nr:Dual specificity protein phosphatase cdc14a [Allomyces arbusculus]
MPVYSAVHANVANPYAASGAAHAEVEFIPSRLYFTSSPQDLSARNASSPDAHYFTIDHVLVYMPFCADFGPPNMAHLYRFLVMLDRKLKDPSLASKRIVLYSSTDHDKRANAAYLISAFMMIAKKQAPEQAYRPLVGHSPPFMPYRDAGSGPATYFLTVLDCLKGLHRAQACGLFSFAAFSLDEYEKHEKVEWGDFNWISPKFLAFASPADDLPVHPRTGWGIQMLADYFAQHGIVSVVRLNNKLYDKVAFTARGIEHVEMYFPDGSCPSDAIVRRFLDLAESRDGPLAVHCKAGLGRTGSLIAAYIMKHYKFTASEVIAFLRIMRPGSVVGPQQNWLHAKQNEFHRMLDGVTRDELDATVARPMYTSGPAAVVVDRMDVDELPSPTTAGGNVMYAPIPAQPRKTVDPNDPHTVVQQGGGRAPRRAAAASAAVALQQSSHVARSAAYSAAAASGNARMTVAQQQAAAWATTPKGVSGALPPRAMGQARTVRAPAAAVVATVTVTATSSGAVPGTPGRRTRKAGPSV